MLCIRAFIQCHQPTGPYWFRRNTRCLAFKHSYYPMFLNTLFTLNHSWFLQEGNGAAPLMNNERLALDTIQSTSMKFL